MRIKKNWFKSLLAILLMVSVLGLSNFCWSAPTITAKENLDLLIKTKSCQNCDLSGLNLSRMDLAGADLEGADLSLTKLFLVNLSQANLKNSNLSGAVFGGADLGEADLRGADLRGANLDGAYLEGAQMDGIFVTTTPYEEVGDPDIEKEVYVADPAKPKKSPENNEIKVAQPRYFTEPPPPPLVAVDEIKPGDNKEIDGAMAEPVVEAKINPLPQAPPSKTVTALAPVQIDVEEEKKENKQVKKVEVESVEVIKEEITDSEKPEDKQVAVHPVASEIIPKPMPIMAEVDMTALVDDEKNAILQSFKRKNRCYGCDLSGLDFSGKDLDKADLEKANLSNTNFEGADLDGANLKGADLKGANFRNAKLRKADLYKADLSGTDFTGADVSGAMFDDAKTDTAIGLNLSSDS